MKKSIYSYADYRKYLNDMYLQMKAKRSSCSHRYIEQHVGISQGYFSRIISGNKNITDRVIQQFIEFLKLSKNEGRFFENLVKYTQTDDPTVKQMYYSRMMALASPSVAPLVKEQFAYFTEVHHVAVRALVELTPINEQSDFEKLGSLLMPPISGNALLESIHLLEKLGLITKDDSNTFHVTDRIVSAGNHPGDLVIRTYLQNSLKTAIEALNSVIAKERMSSVMTVSISPQIYEQVLELLAETRARINTLVENENNATRIYQLSMNLVPISKHIDTGRSDEK
jgi:uncharacterized protein (TIGR02147 family)